MTKPEAGVPNPEAEEGLLEDGWSKLDGGGEFASEHTTVDPSLLNRLAALDRKKKAAASADGIKAPERRDRTINLDISDLLAMEVGEDPDKTKEAAFEAAESKEAEPPSEEAPEPAPSEGSETAPQPELKVEVVEEKPGPTPELTEGSGSIKAMAGPRSGDSSAQVSDVSSPEHPSVELDNAVAEDVAPEFFSEKTQIFIPAMDDEPTRAKLKVVQGGGQQKEYLLARDRITIGRGTNNDILVPDIAISRQHCEITRQSDGSFRTADLSSGNGTKLNGKRMIDSDLFGGDRIEIGNTILEFVITGPGASRKPGDRRINLHPSESKVSPHRHTGGNPAVVQPPVEQVPNYSGGPGYNATMTHFQLQQASAQPNRTGMVLTAAVGLFSLLFLLLALVIGAKVYLDFQSTKIAQVNNKPASEYFFEGVEHVKTRDWDKAEEKFTIAIDLAKEEREFQIRKDAELQLERVRTEKVNEKSFNRGRSLFEKGDFTESIAKLSSVKTGSVYDDEAKVLLVKAKDKYASELVEQAQTHFEAK
jgi:pSer/pThr/pTyr-binding forkhead associated (FHA) protein